MRNDERFEIERAFDLAPHVLGSSWAAVWFRMRRERNPTRAEYRAKALEYLRMAEPLFDSYPDTPEFADIRRYIAARRDKEYERIVSGRNNEIEKRYDRYIDYG
ncbi:MAG: hypothetical protein OXP12_08795 [Thaumarchaeota archaeon]|nr:hypothetical protein [Nitrososphaerota archaeon]MDE0265908.1 hypothetical protein [Nitrososphaerota archaeon]MDE0525385.1 hypothetical protein [Nitrososphaerota archaeon]